MNIQRDTEYRFGELVQSPEYSLFEYVDLGLPSGTLWAKMNVGAKSETDYGLYFAWAEIKGYPDASTKAFEWEDYKWGNPYPMFTKYNKTDKKKLETLDDAASMNIGGFWKMPSREQLEELIYYTNHEWIINYQDSGVNGALFTSTINENTIFIPAAGYCFAGEVEGIGLLSLFWISNYEPNDQMAYMMSCDNSQNFVADVMDRCNGLSVRGVIGSTSPGLLPEEPQR